MIVNPDGTPLNEDQIVLDMLTRIRLADRSITDWRNATVERMVAQFIRTMTLARNYGVWITAEVTTRIVTAVWEEMQSPDPTTVYLHDSV